MTVQPAAAVGRGAPHDAAAMRVGAGAQEPQTLHHRQVPRTADSPCAPVNHWRLARRLMNAGIATTTLLVMAQILAALAPALAELRVRSPTVEEGEIELEHVGALLFDRRYPSRMREQVYTNSIGYGLTSWWKAELEMQLLHEPGQSLHYQATTLENTFQITPRGRYYLDVGFFVEYAKAMRREDHDTITLGPIVQKSFGPAVLTLNTFFERTIGGPGHTDATAFQGAFQAVYRSDPRFAPGLEYHMEIEDLGRPGRFRDQEHRLGPVIIGRFDLGDAATLKYELGYLLPLTHGAHGGALRWKLALELRL